MAYAPLPFQEVADQRLWTRYTLVSLLLTFLAGRRKLATPSPAHPYRFTYQATPGHGMTLLNLSYGTYGSQ